MTLPNRDRGVRGEEREEGDCGRFEMQFDIYLVELLEQFRGTATAELFDNDINCCTSMIKALSAFVITHHSS